MNIPGCGGCDGIRKEPDGTVWLTRPNKHAENYLDRVMLRVRPNERRWTPIPEGQQSIKSIELYRGAHEDQIGLVLGKGPSLSRFLKEAPKQRWHVVPIGINETALVYPCKYVFVLDEDPIARLIRGNVNSVACLQSRHTGVAFRQIAYWEWTKHATPGHETVPVALEVAAGVFGIKTFVMVGFDGYDSPEDLYAPELGVPPRNGTEGYAAINNHIDKVAERYRLRLVWWHRGGAARLEGHAQLTKRTGATDSVTTKPRLSTPS